MMPKVSSETTCFIDELHAAIDAHLDWVRRVLRFAVLRTSPGDEILAPSAHTHCEFGRWFASNKTKFEILDAQKAQRLDAVHREMHDAVRTICTELKAGRGGLETELDAFDQTQSELINLLAEFSTLILENDVK